MILCIPKNSFSSKALLWLWSLNTFWIFLAIRQWSTKNWRFEVWFNNILKSMQLCNVLHLTVLLFKVLLNHILFAIFIWQSLSMEQDNVLFPYKMKWSCLLSENLSWMKILICSTMHFQCIKLFNLNRIERQTINIKSIWHQFKMQMLRFLQ